jgi:hypothetical protein
LDGRELYYLATSGELMSVAFRAGPPVTIGTAVPLFQASARVTDLVAPYDVSAAGDRFLINRLVPASAAGSITLDQNWSTRR